MLTTNKIYAWGDPDTFVLGRKPLIRRKFKQSLEVEALSVRNVVDIFSGGYHCFLKTTQEKDEQIESRYFAWGLNNYG